MLQQTTARTVEGRWRRFLDRFPDVTSLANAPLDDVLNEWSGLGYYARARNLHAAAQRIVEDCDGNVPERFEQLLALPGMGRYTAAAVASIAFGEPVALLDANVERVLARLLAEGGNVRTASVKKRLWDAAQDLLSTQHPGDWNQAMMELGATVCLPQAPQCPSCPLRRWCAAREAGEPERYPVKGPKPALEQVREAAVVLRRGRRVFVLRRPARGSFAGMWELPRGEAGEPEASRDAALRIAREQTGTEVRIRSPRLKINHVVMRRRIELTVWDADIVSGKPAAQSHERGEWMTPEEWLQLPISTTQRKIALLLAGRDVSAKGNTAKQREPEPDLFSED